MRRMVLILFSILGLSSSDQLLAQLSPGPLAAPHEHLSGLMQCLTCHTWGSKDLADKCLNCHTPVRDRIAQQTGYHGSLSETGCAKCHSDHLGRDFNMIHWEPSQTDFDHGKTGFDLDGKHRDLVCEDCHNQELIQAKDVLTYAATVKTADVLASSFLGLGSACSDCHADVHNDEFADQSCQDCHNSVDWQEAKQTFNHDERTNYPLEGAHKKLDCSDCHTESQTAIGDFQAHIFSGQDFDQCTDCHKDEHQDSFGQDCLKCHTVFSFKTKNQARIFNHDATNFPLRGRHREVACATCHTSKTVFNSITNYDACTDCHKDKHEGAFDHRDTGSGCDQCHDVNGFTPPLFGVFEHSKTRFPLEGAHLAQPCLACHLKNDKSVYVWDHTSCNTCHASVHGKQFAKYNDDKGWCEKCHESSDWTELRFQHNNTNFHLTGKHAERACMSCHKQSQDIIQYEDTETACSSCHADVHADQFQNKICSECHGTSSWKLPDFNHLTLTHFPLDGQHEALKCGACHKFEGELGTIRFKPIAHECQDCHNFKSMTP